MSYTAAMQTDPPRNPDHWMWGRWRRTFARRPTDLMVHVPGHGPRRVYRSDYTGRYFYVLGRRPVTVDPADVLRSART